MYTLCVLEVYSLVFDFTECLRIDSEILSFKRCWNFVLGISSSGPHSIPRLQWAKPQLPGAALSRPHPEKAGQGAAPRPEVWPIDSPPPVLSPPPKVSPCGFTSFQGQPENVLLRLNLYLFIRSDLTYCIGGVSHYWGIFTYLFGSWTRCILQQERVTGIGVKGGMLQFECEMSLWARVFGPFLFS